MNKLMNKVFCSQHCVKVKINLLNDGRMKGKIGKLAKCLVSEKKIENPKELFVCSSGGTTEESTWCFRLKRVSGTTIFGNEYAMNLLKKNSPRVYKINTYQVYTL